MPIDPTTPGLQEEWCEDLGGLLEEAAKSSAVDEPNWKQWLEERFWTQHPDDPAGEEKTTRVWAAFTFLMAHRSKLDGVVVSRDKSLIDGLLLRALFRIFIGWPEDLLDSVPLEVVVREYRREVDSYEKNG